MPEDTVFIASGVKHWHGASKDSVFSHITGVADEFARLNDDVLFGEVWSRTSYLDVKRRCILTIVALTSTGITDSSLQYHIINAKKNGVSENELTESLTHIAMYVGWPKIWATLKYIKEVYCK